MQFLDALKRYLFRRSLKRETALLIRNGELKNYANSRYIGIWFDARDRERFAAIDVFARKLAAKGKKVELLGYVGKMKKGEDIPFDYLAPNEVGWTGKPTEGTIELWAGKPYDLLLCMHTGPCLPLEYLAMLSKAKCRVGRYSDDSVECYDLMASLGEGKELSDMVKQVDKLLTEINKNVQQNAA